MMPIVPAHEGHALQDIRKLFEAYAASLGIKLDFQDFDNEMRDLPGDDAPPGRCLLLAKWQEAPASGIALRPLDKTICEMKRLYTGSAFRGLLRIGRSLAEAAIAMARQIGSSHMRLDTLPSMPQARAMYASLGFRPIDPYRYHPIAGTTFMELTL